MVYTMLNVYEVYILYAVYRPTVTIATECNYRVWVWFYKALHLLYTSLNYIFQAELSHGFVNPCLIGL